MIERVHDIHDPRVTDYAHVGDPDWLREHGLFVAEGRLVVARLVQDRTFVVRSLLLTPTALAALADCTRAAGCPVYVAEQALLSRVAGFNFHRGCLALAERPRDFLPANALAGAALLVALEGVGNPDNVGGIFRNALAFGAGGVLLDPASGDPLYRKAIRTSMAATLRVPFARLEPWPAALERFRRDGYRIVALTPAPGAVPLEDHVARGGHDRVILLLGAEGAGLTAGALALADERVRIPIAPDVDSLNVTVAAGIALAALAAPRLR